MKRAINYIIEKEDEGRKISGFLRGRGYSYQNLVELKKIPESVVLNGEPVFLNTRLNDRDALEISRRECLPIRPGTIMTIPWPTDLRNISGTRERISCSAARTGWTGIHPV